jgi:anti-sigma factor RsiW
VSDVTSRLSEQDMAELCALADGTLPVERRAAVEARVAADPALQELLDRQRRSLVATRALADEPAPDSLRIPAAPRRQDRSRAGWSGLRPRRLAVAGALATALAIMLVVLIGGPGGPTVAEAAELAGRPASGPAPRPAGNGGTQLSLGVDGVVFPDLLQAFGWQAVGVRHDTLDGRRATIVFYEKDGKQIAYVIVAGSALERPSDAPASVSGGVTFQTFQTDDRIAVTWQRQGHTCVLIGELPPEELLALASWRGY